jgi:hypothetical protein
MLRVPFRPSRFARKRARLSSMTMKTARKKQALLRPVQFGVARP